MDSTQMFAQLPTGLREELLHAFNKIAVNFREGKWEPSELNGGKLCEVIYSILDGHIKGVYPQKAHKPTNMVDACLGLAQASTSFPRSVRIQIPRMLISLYEIRNNRGVGHVGGEVDPNRMDSTVVLGCAKWLMAEMVRIFHNIDIESASLFIEALTEKEVAMIWNVNNNKRVLNTRLSMKDKTLVLLYSENRPLEEATLVSWTEHTNPAVYRRDVLVPGHKAKLWEYDKSSREISLSPLGIAYVEEKIL